MVEHLDNILKALDSILSTGKQANRKRMRTAGGGNMSVIPVLICQTQRQGQDDHQKPVSQPHLNVFLKNDLVMVSLHSNRYC